MNPAPPVTIKLCTAYLLRPGNTISGFEICSGHSTTTHKPGNLDLRPEDVIITSHFQL
jgi:hypothetical protein